jgi:hypothetical protein
MSDVKYELTAEQIKDIYRAGIREGNDEATSFECGSSRFVSTYDYLEEVLIYDLKICGDIDYDQKAPWWKSFKEQAGIK